MKKIERFNNSANYCNTAFDFGFRTDKIPDKPVYSAREDTRENDSHGRFPG